MSDTMSDAGESTGTGAGKQELSKDQLKVLRDAFNAFDKEKTGSISTDVVGTILELLGHKLSEEELEDVIEEYDEDESGQLEFDEFVALASNYVEPEEDYDALRKELREVFMMYDKDGKFVAFGSSFIVGKNEFFEMKSLLTRKGTLWYEFSALELLSR
uniref:EF-hand domain-containing protein n=1 Tax=Anopheles maculatus TaxID=74869 RepID=A0A182SCS8_9DIPT